MAQASPGLQNAEIHLKRAYGFIQEVEKATEDFRQQAIAHDAQVQSDQPFLQGMIGTIRGSRQLAQQKSALFNDLQLSEQEVGRAYALDPKAFITTKDGDFGNVELRCWIAFMKGQLEMIWGKDDVAIQKFNESIQIAEIADAHYMLGLIYESRYQPAEALKHFERCLQLDPAGELSVPALREVSAMKNYKKRFRGSWGVFCLLLIIWPVAIIYFLVNRK